MTRQAPAPAYVDVPLPLECADCHHSWPTCCTCQHPASCRTCHRDLAHPATAAGYCSIDCFRSPPR